MGMGTSYQNVLTKAKGAKTVGTPGMPSAVPGTTPPPKPKKPATLGGSYKL